MTALNRHGVGIHFFSGLQRVDWIFIKHYEMYFNAIGEDVQSKSESSRMINCRADVYCPQPLRMRCPINPRD